MKLIRGILAALLLAAAPAFAGHEGGAGVDPGKAWNLLRDGNDRFARNLPAYPHSSLERRNEVIEAQHPYAVVLSCSDSRVPIERVVDAGLGDIFSIRVAGNNPSGEMVLGSLEY